MCWKIMMQKHGFLVFIVKLTCQVYIPWAPLIKLWLTPDIEDVARYLPRISFKEVYLNALMSELTPATSVEEQRA